MSESPGARSYELSLVVQVKFRVNVRREIGLYVEIVLKQSRRNKARHEVEPPALNEFARSQMHVKYSKVQLSTVMMPFLSASIHNNKAIRA